MPEANGTPQKTPNSLIEFTLRAPRVRFYFTLIGEPTPWKRVGHRKGDGKAFNKSAAAQSRIAWETKCCCPHLRPDDPEGPVQLWGMRALFYFKNPAGSQVDVDNCAKNIMDALQGTAWHKDNRVRELYCCGVWTSRRPRSEVLIYHLEEDTLAMRSELNL